MASKTTRTAQMAQDSEDVTIIDGTAGRVDNPLMPLDDLDTEESWDVWIDSLKSADAAGTVRVYKLPLDSEGNPTMAKGARQILLITCPHQQYGFDELIMMVKSRFMMPGELATIRIMGTRSGARGVMFNRMVSIQKESSGTNAPASEGGNMLGVIQAMQTQTRQTAEMMERILSGNRLPEVQQQKPASDVIKEWLGILGPLFAPAILAYVNRPQPKSDLEGLIGAMVKLKDLTGEGGGGGGDDENTTLGIVKAVAGPGLQLLNTLAQNKAQPAVAQRVRRIPPGISQLAAHPVPAQDGKGPHSGANAPIPGEVHSGTPSPAAPVVVPTSGASSIPPSVPTSNQEDNAMLAQLAPQLEQLATLAEQGADPSEVSKLVLDMLPDNEEIDNKLYGILSDAASFSRLALLAPKMKTHAEWFEKLRVAMLTEFEEQKEV